MLDFIFGIFRGVKNFFCDVWNAFTGARKARKVEAVATLGLNASTEDGRVVAVINSIRDPQNNYAVGNPEVLQAADLMESALNTALDANNVAARKPLWVLAADFDSDVGRGVPAERNLLDRVRDAVRYMNATYFTPLKVAIVPV